jgi:septal ring factor EnvC (AmiA/AmiB activator)
MSSTRRHLRILGIVLGWSLASGFDYAHAQGDEAQALQTVRSEIRILEGRLADQQAEREGELLVLQEAELKAAAATEALREIRQQVAAQRAQRQALLEKTRLANLRLDRERGALAEQVRMSYVAGRQEMLKLLLSQDSAVRLGRLVVYYDYLNRARSQRLEDVESEIESFAQLATDSTRVGRELNRLEQTQADELKILESSRNERRAVLGRLVQDIATSGEEIRYLRDDERRLSELVAELQGLLELLPLGAAESFPSIKGQLAWPVSGSLISDFGHPRAGGQLRWNGVVVGAPSGTPVRAAYYGRVAYADWLPGLGLLIILDHGAGYMTLYGHNAALLKESGDSVVPGDIIAHVGDSGGQTQTALYFEVRQNGEPIDPHPWMGEDLSPAR